MHWPKKGATLYPVQLGLPDIGRAIKELVVYQFWVYEPDVRVSLTAASVRLGSKSDPLTTFQLLITVGL